MAEVSLDLGKTAILMGDFYEDMILNLSHAVERKVLEKAQTVLKAARDAGILVCYSATVFRPGYPEISDRNKIFRQRKTSGQPAAGDPLKLIHPSLRPVEGEIVVGKHRVNALYGTGLDVVLRANDIETLIITGYATGGVVLSTARFAADLDYRLLVVEDCCWDSDPEVHDFLTQRILPRQADVITSEELIRALGGS
jgi:nicotinamidase-related amidase